MRLGTAQDLTSRRARAWEVPVPLWRLKSGTYVWLADDNMQRQVQELRQLVKRQSALLPPAESKEAVLMAWLVFSAMHALQLRTQVRA